MGFGGLIKGLPSALGRGLKGIAGWEEEGWPGSRRPGPEAMEYAQTNTGSPFPLVYGTRRIDQPVMKWKGNERVTVEAGGAIRYHTDMLFGCGVPNWDSNAAPYNNWRATRPPRLRRVWYGDELCRKGTGTVGVSVVPGGDFMDIAHGEETLMYLPTSAVVNYVEFLDGRRTQKLSDTLYTRTLVAMANAGVNAAHIPGWRHQLLVSFTSIDHAGIGFDPHVKPFGFEIESAGPQAIASGDFYHANPAWVFYDLLTRPVWGAGVDPARVDLSAFTTAASTLVTEGLGISLVVYQRTPLRDLLQGLLAHVAGVSFVDPATGKITLRLMRPADASVATATVDNLAGRPKLGHFGWQDTKNVVRIHFVNQDRDYRPDTAQDDRLGSSVGQSNRIRDFEETYGGCVSATQAAQLASRDLSAVARPLIAGTVPLNREFYDLKPGDVITGNWPVFDLNSKRLRVLDVNDGQLGRGTIEAEVVEDVFGDTSTSGSVSPTDDNVLNVLPLTERLFDEAPYYLCEQSYEAGRTTSLDQRGWAHAVPEGLARQFREDTLITGGLVLTTGTLTTDVPMRFFDACAFVETNYPRTADPYDTDIGLRITTAGLTSWGLTAFNNMKTALDAFEADQSLSTNRDNEIAQNQHNLILVVPAGQKYGGELMAFETMEQVSATVWRLVNPWRGLGDTVPVDHLVGASVYWVSLSSIGTKPYALGRTALGNASPQFIAITGSGDEGDDVRTVGSPTGVSGTAARRMDRPLRLAHLRASGYEASGLIATGSYSAGISAALKEVTDLDGALNLAANQNTNTAGKLVRGDETAYSAPAGTTFDVYAQKSGESEVAIQTGISGTFAPAGVLLGKAGHGAIDVVPHTIAAGVREWQAPKLRVTAPRFRNLLANGSFEYGALSPGWTLILGAAATVSSDTSSLSQAATGKYVRFTAGETKSMSQTADVTGYKAKGLDARVTIYVRSFVGAESVTVTIDPLDAADASLGSSTSGALAGPTDHWRRFDFDYADLPSGTAKIKVTVAASGTSVGFTRVCLTIGQASAEMILNGSFSTGTFTSWTDDTNSFVAETGVTYASDDGSTKRAARGGDFSTSTIRQDVTVSNDYKSSTAVLEFAIAWLSASGAVGDTWQITIQARDFGGSVLSSLVTSPSALVLSGSGGGLVALSDTPNVWHRQRYALNLPDETATVRVFLTANRAGGTTCGIAYDDVSLRLHKPLDPTTDYISGLLNERDFNFGTPSRARAPDSWQRFHLHYPDLAIPVVFDGVNAKPSVQSSEVLDVGAAYTGSGGLPGPLGIMRGYFKVNEETAADDLNAYVFERSGVNTLVVTERLDGMYGKFAHTDSFTVAVLLRSTEFTWGGATGLVGRRRDSGGDGWGIGIDATGHARATFSGTSSSLTVTSSDIVCDRSPRWVIMRCDGTNMKLYTKAGTQTTALVGLGATTVNDVSLRIGTDWIGSTSFAGQIARVYIWDSAVAEADIQAMVAELGKDPSGLLTTWTNDAPIWVPGAPNSSGAALVRCAATDIPIGYSATLDADGDGYGLVTTAENTNRIVTNDVTDTAHWGGAAGTTVTTGITDPTGLPRGVRVAQSSAGAFYTHTDMTAFLSAVTWRTIFYARKVGSPAVSLDVQLLDSNLASKGTVTVALTTSWQRFEISHAWDGATPTAHLRWVVSGGGTGTYELGHVVWSGFVGATGTANPPPIAIQDAATSISDTRAVRSESLTAELNHEGEIYVEATGTAGDAVFSSVIASIDNNADKKNQRALIWPTGVGGGNMSGFLEMFDNTPSSLAATSEVVFAPTTSWQARARWNRLAIPDGGTGTPQRGSIAAKVAGAANTYAYDALSAWSMGTAGPSTIRIGGASLTDFPATPSLIIRRVIVRSRESKLDGVT